LVDAGIGIVIILFFTAVQSFLNRTVEWRWVREFALGKDSIEGFWLDVVKERDQIISCGYVNIYYEDAMYVVEGEVYNRDGVKQGTFKTTLSAYNKKKLL